MKSRLGLLLMGMVPLVAACVEIVPVELVVPSVVCRGEDIAPASLLRVGNAGDEPTSGFFHVGWYLSDDEVWDAADRLLVGGRDQVGVLLPSEIKTVSLGVNIIPNDVAPGDRFLIVKLDEFDGITEADESNNVIVRAVRVQTCDTGCPLPPPAPGPTTDERANAVEVDGAGAIVVAGSRRPAAGDMDTWSGFLRKTASDGVTVLWERNINRCFWDQVEDVAVDAAGDIAIVGSTRGGAFGTVETDVMVRKYTRDGRLLWSALQGGPLGETGLGVAFDPSSGAVVVTGAATTVTDIQLMLARYQARGDLSFARNVPIRHVTVGQSVAVSSSGAIAVAGDSADAIEPTVPPLATIARFTPGGALSWWRTAGDGASFNEGVDVAFVGEQVASLGLAGTFGTVPGGPRRIPIVTKYDAAGAVLWSDRPNLGRAYNPAAALRVGNAGQVVVVGHHIRGPAFGNTPWLRRYSAGGAILGTGIPTAPTLTQVAGAALTSFGATTVVLGQAGTPAAHTVLAFTATP